MKIVLTIHHALNVDSGAAGTVLRLADEYRRAGHAVSLLSFDDLPKTWPDSVKTIIFPIWVAWRLFVRDGGAEIIDASSGDAALLYCLPLPATTLRVTHSHGLPHTIHALRMKDRAAGRALGWPYRLYRGSLHLWLDTLSLKRAHLALLLNRADRDYAVMRLGVSPDRASLVGNGLPEHFFAQDPPADRAVAGDPFVIVQVGSYIARKGIDTTSAALVPLMRTHPDVEFRFMGSGVGEDVVRADYPSDLQPRLRVVPAFRNDELPALLADAALILMPSTSEGFGLAALEGMACGLVPVTSDIPGPTEYVRDGENGLTFPSGDADALATAIARLYGDRELARRLQKRAVATAAQYRLTQIAAERLALCVAVRRRLVDAGSADPVGRTRSKVAAMGCIAAIVVLAWLPKEVEEPLRTGLPGQLEHLIAYFGAAGVLKLTWPDSPIRWTALGFFALAGILEIGQFWVPGRNSQFIDFAASALGALTGLWAAHAWLQRLRPAMRDRGGTP